MATNTAPARRYGPDDTPANGSPLPDVVPLRKAAVRQPTWEEFQAQFRGRHLLFLTEAWSVRRESPSAMGLMMDAHALQLKKLLKEMYEAMKLE